MLQHDLYLHCQTFYCCLYPTSTRPGNLIRSVLLCPANQDQPHCSHLQRGEEWSSAATLHQPSLPASNLWCSYLLPTAGGCYLAVGRGARSSEGGEPREEKRGHPQVQQQGVQHAHITHLQLHPHHPLHCLRFQDAKVP